MTAATSRTGAVQPYGQSPSELQVIVEMSPDVICVVDDIGLSGVLVREKETERTIFLRAEPWVPEQTRVFFAVGQVEGNQVSCPMVLHVRRQ